MPNDQEQPEENLSGATTPNVTEQPTASTETAPTAVAGSANMNGSVDTAANNVTLSDFRRFTDLLKDQFSAVVDTIESYQKEHLPTDQKQQALVITEASSEKPIVDSSPTPASVTTDTTNTDGGRLAHGFKRSFFSLSPSFVKKSKQDRYGYLFDTKSAIPCTDENRDLLIKIGRNMVDPLNIEDPAQFSTIDSGYTYWGQFIDHDLTLDLDSSMKGPVDAATLPNYRTPNFDLDSLYGDGPGVSSYMYDVDQVKLIVGTASNRFDLPRTFAAVAIVGDPRNDENLFVAQFHVSLIRFHNAVVDKLKSDDPTLSGRDLFKKAQIEVRRHYQWLILYDFLPTIVGQDIIDDIKTSKLKIFSPEQVSEVFIPVEFSVAAYRFGHSMVRNNYTFNQAEVNQDFGRAFDFTKTFVSPIWNIDWSAFFSEGDRIAQNKARKIDTRVAFSMGHLRPAKGDSADDYFTVLSARNLVRSMALQVPTGQAVAEAMGVSVLTEEELLASPYDKPTPDETASHQNIVDALSANDGLLLHKTPLWYYILKEAEIQQQGNRLGAVGGRLVAEVIVRIIGTSSDNIIDNPDWKPTCGLGDTTPENYKIMNLVRFAGTFPPVLNFS